MTLLPRMCACTHACMHTHKHTHTHKKNKEHTGYWTSAPIRSPICRCLKICQAKNNTIIKQYARFENRVICISSAQLTESNTPNNDSCGYNTCTVEKREEPNSQPMHAHTVLTWTLKHLHLLHLSTERQCNREGELTVQGWGQCQCQLLTCSTFCLGQCEEKTTK